MNDLKTLIILFKAYQHVEKNVKQSISNSHLTIHEFAIMEALFTKQTLTINQLIDLVLIPNSSMSHVLVMLEKKNYIQRTLNPNDKRQAFISLTKSGKEEFETLYQHHFSDIRPLFDCLSTQEETHLQELLKKLGKHAERNLLNDTRTTSRSK